MKVFVYGTLKTNQSNNDFLENSKFIKKSITTPEYLLYDFGPYPCLVKTEEGKNIEGEIWEVDRQTLKALDRLEGVGYGLYERVRINLVNVEEKVWGYLYLNDVSELEEAGTCWGE